MDDKDQFTIFPIQPSHIVQIPLWTIRTGMVRTHNKPWTSSDSSMDDKDLGDDGGGGRCLKFRFLYGR